MLIMLPFFGVGGVVGLPTDAGVKSAVGVAWLLVGVALKAGLLVGVVRYTCDALR